MPALIDLTGQRFGRLTVLKRANKKGPKPKWTCRCECGNLSIACASDLRSGHHLSCGCLRTETTIQRNYKHGASKRGHQRPEITAWVNMRNRCYDQSQPAYRKYGGRGIIVCERWRNSSVAFLEDMGQKPSRKHSLDRINNNGNYEPGNCRWATAKQQVANRRLSRVPAVDSAVVLAALPTHPSTIQWMDLVSACRMCTATTRIHLAALMRAKLAVRISRGLYARV